MYLTWWTGQLTKILIFSEDYESWQEVMNYSNDFCPALQLGLIAERAGHTPDSSCGGQSATSWGGDASILFACRDYRL